MHPCCESDPMPLHACMLSIRLSWQEIRVHCAEVPSARPQPTYAKGASARRYKHLGRPAPPLSPYRSRHRASQAAPHNDSTRVLRHLKPPYVRCASRFCRTFILTISIYNYIYVYLHMYLYPYLNQTLKDRLCTDSVSTDVGGGACRESTEVRLT